MQDFRGQMHISLCLDIENYIVQMVFASARGLSPTDTSLARFRAMRRVSTTLRQVLAKFSEFFVC